VQQRKNRVGNREAALELPPPSLLPCEQHIKARLSPYELLDYDQHGLGFFSTQPDQCPPRLRQSPDLRREILDTVNSYARDVVLRKASARF
jgi:hypothetical protein